MSSSTVRRWSGLTPWARWAEVGLFLVSLAYALYFWVRLPARLPTEVDYQAMQETLRREARPGDAVALLPFWADRGKLYLRGIPVVTYPQLAQQLDAERYQRLWVLAQPDLPRSDAEETLEELSQKLERLEPARRFGPLSLSLFQPRSGRAPTYDFLQGTPQADGIAAARVEWHEFNFLPRRCILIQPSGPSGSLRFSGVPVRSGIRGALGTLGGEARLQLSVDGRKLPPVETGAGTAASYQPFELNVPALVPGNHDVEFQLQGRAVCLDAVAF